MDPEFTEAFTELVRDLVDRGDEVELEGVGTFRPEHRNQFQKQFEDGQVVMMPPRDSITFIPDDRN